ncbi:hypothetical protein C8F01DRAFT_216556 [Mycena amicta]|nr:hypothetical protein C8F01DRAFT_216556 [Mycena amicta]
MPARAGAGVASFISRAALLSVKLALRFSLLTSGQSLPYTSKDPRALCPLIPPINGDFPCAPIPPPLVCHG